MNQTVLLILAAIVAWASWRGFVRPAMPPARSAFDTCYDVETDGEIPVGQLGMPADIAAQAERYMPTEERLLEVTVAFAGIEPMRFSFVDLGGRKGLLLILAAQLRFRRPSGWRSRQRWSIAPGDPARLPGRGGGPDPGRRAVRLPAGVGGAVPVQPV